MQSHLYEVELGNIIVYQGAGRPSSDDHARDFSLGLLEVQFRADRN
jgi:hypothetical protein